MKKIITSVFLMVSMSAAIAGPYKECSKNRPVPPCQFAGVMSAFLYSNMISENKELIEEMKSLNLKVKMPTMKALFTKTIQSFYLGEEDNAFVRHEIRVKNVAGKYKIYVDHPMRGQDMYYVNTIEKVLDY